MLLFAVIAILAIAFAAYRKYRFEEQETWRRMPQGNDEEVIPPDDESDD